MDHDTTWLLRRSETEAIRAIASPHPAAAAAHRQLCLLYTGRALAALLPSPVRPERSRGIAFTAG